MFCFSTILILINGHLFICVLYIVHIFVCLDLAVASNNILPLLKETRTKVIWQRTESLWQHHQAPFPLDPTSVPAKWHLNLLNGLS